MKADLKNRTDLAVSEAAAIRRAGNKHSITDLWLRQTRSTQGSNLSESHGANERLQISNERFKRAITPQQKAQYLSNLIDNIPEGKIPASAPMKCPIGNIIQELDPPQVIPKMLITPESPIRRLLCVQPPGAGKTCIMLDILTNFLDKDWDILLVGDADIFLSIEKDLRKCPAMVGHKFLRDRNSNFASPWCALYSQAKDEILASDVLRPSSECKGAEQFKKARIYWLTYVLLGNWLGGKYTKYSNPFKRNTLILMDEVHKLTAPSEEANVSPQWRQSLYYVGKQLSEAGEDDSTNPIVVGFTGTPIIDDPVQAICLATVFKGRTDPSIYTDESMQTLRVPPKSFYTSRFVDKPSHISIKRPGLDDPISSMLLDDVKQILSENKCIQFPNVSKKSTSGRGVLSDHPCPVTPEERSRNLLEVFHMKPETEKALTPLFSNLFFVTNNTADPRKYPPIHERHHTVSYTESFERKAQEALRSCPGLSWLEVSNCAFPQKMKAYVLGRLTGTPHTAKDTVFFEEFCPKWAKLVKDMTSSSKMLAGKTAIYLGARGSKVASSTDYLIALSFYLQDQLKLKDGLGENEGQGACVYVMSDIADDRDILNSDTGSTLRFGSKHIRREQLTSFNNSSCVGTLHNSNASKYSVLLLGYEAYKALDLTCVSNLVRMVLQPSGRAIQTVGRARRSCSFRTVAKNLWDINAVTYVFRNQECPPSDCDCLLESFYAAKSQLDASLLKLIRGLSIGCSNFQAYNQWPKGTVCLLDKGAPRMRLEHEKTRTLYFCSVHDDKGAILHGVSGDVSVEMVRETSAGKCSELQCNNSAIIPLADLQHIRGYDRLLIPDIEKKEMARQLSPKSLQSSSSKPVPSQTLSKPVGSRTSAVTLSAARTASPRAASPRAAPRKAATRTAPLTSSDPASLRAAVPRPAAGTRTSRAAVPRPAARKRASSAAAPHVSHAVAPPRKSSLRQVGSMSAPQELERKVRFKK
jgi:hypothetical protein